MAFRARYSEETAKKAFRLLVKGFTVLEVAVETGLTEAQIGSLKIGGTATYHYLFVQFKRLLPPVRKLGPREVAIDDGFDVRACPEADRADRFISPDEMYRITLAGYGMPMNPPKRVRDPRGSRVLDWEKILGSRLRSKASRNSNPARSKRR